MEYCHIKHDFLNVALCTSLIVTFRIGVNVIEDWWILKRTFSVQAKKRMYKEDKEAMVVNTNYRLILGNTYSYRSLHK